MFVLILLSDGINSYFSPFSVFSLHCCFKVRHLPSVKWYVAFPSEGSNVHYSMLEGSHIFSLIFIEIFCFVINTNLKAE